MLFKNAYADTLGRDGQMRKKIELEESGFSDIKKVVDDDLKRKIQLILRSGK